MHALKRLNSSIRKANTIKCCCCCWWWFWS